MTNQKQMLNEIQIYVNSNGINYEYILLANQKHLDNGGTLNGCMIRDPRRGMSKLGYSEGFNKDLFRPLRDDESIDFNMYGYAGLEYDIRLIKETSKFSYMPYRDLLIVPNHGYNDQKSIIVDLTYGSFILMDKYFRNNPLTLKLTNKGRKGFNLYKIKSDDGILISNEEPSNGYIDGCGISKFGMNNGYGTWNMDLVEKISEAEIEFLYNKVEIRGNKILVKRNEHMRDCIIDISSGKLYPAFLSSYRENNPLIIKLKNKKKC